MKRIQMKCLAVLMGVLMMPLSQALPHLNNKPVTIGISNDHQAHITLSSKDINRVFVVNDKITSFNAPNNRLVAHNDQSGSVFMTVTGTDTFAVFVATKKGRHFSLLVTPKNESGVTVKFVPKTPAAAHYSNHSPQATQFEASSPYEKTLVKLLDDVMHGKTPPGYSPVPWIDFKKVAITQLPWHPKGWKTLSEKITKGFLGGELAVRVLRVTNHTRHSITLGAIYFFREGVRAVAIEKDRLKPHQSTAVYEVVSNV